MKMLNTLFLSALLGFGLAFSPISPAEGDGYFSQAELDQMLAPVALYPDTVLTHVLIAATYPLEVVQAARWSRNNRHLKGEDAVRAVEHMNWDPSVQALVAFPELLARMDRDLDWTQRLGDAFLMQEEQVADTVQYLRSDAYASGRLRSNDHVRVVRETEYIYIEPARTRVVYVPYYDPRVVYSHWRWSSHPPVYWSRPSGFRLSVGFYWGSGYRVHSGFYRSSYHWSKRQVVVVNHHHHHHRHFRSGRDVVRYKDARRWKHDPSHRRGVDYHRNVNRARFTESTGRAALASQPKSVSDTSSRSGSRLKAAERSGSRNARTARNNRSSAPATTQRNRPDTPRERAQLRSRSETSSRTASRSGDSRPDAATARRALEQSRSRTEARGDSSPRSRSAGVERNQSGRSASTRSSIKRERGNQAARSGSTERSKPSRSARDVTSSRSAGRATLNRGASRSPSREARSSSSRRKPEVSRQASRAPRASTSRGSNVRSQSKAPARASRSSQPRSTSGKSAAPTRSTRSGSNRQASTDRASGNRSAISQNRSASSRSPASKGERRPARGRDAGGNRSERRKRRD